MPHKKPHPIRNHVPPTDNQGQAKLDVCRVCHNMPWRLEKPCPRCNCQPGEEVRSPLEAGSSNYQTDWGTVF